MRFRTVTRTLLFCSIVLGAAALALAQVAPTTIFQLDGNAAKTAAYSGCLYTAPCDYWNLLNGTGNSNTNPLGGIGAGSSPGQSSVRTFLNGTLNTFNFTGGGSKDPSAISSWRYTSTNTPNKDTLNAGYGAAYNLGGHFEVIFGADRLSPNGDANIGIWFFQNNVGPNGSGGFTGSHVDHDVFLISAFTGGGGTSTIEVLEWDHTCAAGVKNPASGQCADTNLRLLANVGIANVCTPTSAYCAVTNSAATTSTWEGSIASPLFFEGGVDITAAFAAVGITQLPCFSSFLVETRSSQSTTAVLKDFLSGGFPVCALSITKSCSAQVDPNGTTIDYSMKGIVTNTGIGTMYGVQVFDTIAPAVTSGPGINVSNNTIVNGVNSPNYGTSTLGAGETGTWSDSDQSASLNQSDSAIAKGATDPSGSPQNTTSTTPATASCGTTPVGTLTITKMCTTTLVASSSDVHVQVSYNGNICNTGNSQVTGLALTDYEHTSTSPTSPTPAPLLSTLAPCTSDGKGGCTNASACTTYSSTYVATTDTPILDGFGNPGTGPGRFNFDDLIVITGAHATVGSLNTVTSGDSRCNSTATAPVYGCATITCPICQGSGECTP